MYPRNLLPAAGGHLGQHAGHQASPYRLLYYEEGDSFLIISACMTGEEAMGDWAWQEKDNFVTPGETSDFDTGKIATSEFGL